MLRLTFLALVAFVVCLTVPALASAAPPCDPDPFISKLTFDNSTVPGVVPNETGGQAMFYVGWASSVSAEEPLVLAFVSSVAGRGLRYGWRRNYASPPSFDGEPSNFPTVPLRFAAEDPPGAIVVSGIYSSSYNNGASYGPCRVTAYSGAIQHAPQQSPLRVGWPQAGNFDDNGWRRSFDFLFDSGLCGDGVQTVELTLPSVRRPVRFRSLRGCAFSERTVRLPGNVVVRTGNRGYALEVSSDISKRDRRDIRWKAHGPPGRTLVGQGRFRLVTGYRKGRPAERVLETDSDRYIKVCVEGDRRTNKDAQGRSYCTISGRPSYWATSAFDLR